MKTPVICCKAGTNPWCHFCRHSRAHTRSWWSTGDWGWATKYKYCSECHDCFFCKAGDYEAFKVRCIKVKP